MPKKLLTLLALMGSAEATVIRATAYNAVGGQTDSTPHLGYCKLNGSHRLPANAIALSDDLRGRYPCGIWIVIKTPVGSYVGVVADRIPGYGKVDILMKSHRKALAFGVQQATIRRY